MQDPVSAGAEMPGGMPTSATKPRVSSGASRPGSKPNSTSRPDSKPNSRSTAVDGVSNKQAPPPVKARSTAVAQPLSAEPRTEGDVVQPSMPPASPAPSQFYTPLNSQERGAFSPAMFFTDPSEANEVLYGTAGKSTALNPPSAVLNEIASESGSLLPVQPAAALYVPAAVPSLGRHSLGKSVSHALAASPNKKLTTGDSSIMSRASPDVSLLS